jgi:excisionase family DNA binding protein
VTKRIREDVLAARREAEAWIEAEDFARWIAGNSPNQHMPRLGFAAFLKDDWYAFTGRKHGAAAERAFERWKAKWAYPTGFLTRWGSLGELTEDRLESALARQVGPGRVRTFYLIPLEGLGASVEAALVRRDQLEEAFGAIRAKPRRRAYKRDATVPEAAASLGIPKPTIYNWIRKHGLPHRREGRKILVSISEIEAWGEAREKAGRRVATSEDVRVRAPSDLARPRLREIRNYLGLTNERFAELLGPGVSKNQVARWLATRADRETRSIPQSVLDRAEVLLDTQLARTTGRTATQRVGPEDLRAALQAAGGKIGKAASLLGIHPQTLSKLAADLGVQLKRDRVPVGVARPRLLAIRNQLNLANGFYAELLGVPEVTLATWLGLGGRWRDLDSIPAAALGRAEEILATLPPRVFKHSRLQRITPEEVREAWKSTGNVKRAAAALSVSPDVFRKLAESRGVEVPVPLVARITKRELKDLLDRHKGVRASMARELGVSAPYVTMLLKQAGLYEGARSSARADTLTAERVQQILEDAIRGEKLPHHAAQEAGLAKGAVLKKAAERHGLGALYGEAKAKGKRRPRKDKGVKKNPPRFQVRSPKQGLRLIHHKDITAKNPDEDDEEPHPSDYMSPTGQDCWIFARALHEVTGLPIYGTTDRAGVVHHAFVLNEQTGEAVDARGFKPLALMQAQARGDGARPLTPDDLAAQVGGFYDHPERLCPPELARGYSDDEWEYALAVARKVVRVTKKNPPGSPRFKVRSPEQGLRVIKHKDITTNYEKALRWKPKHKRAVLVPCAQTKPFPDAPSHVHGYLKALEGKKVDVWVVSEPLGVVPYEWSRRYPANDYDYPPRFLTGRAHDVLAGRVTRWLNEVARKYELVVLALPAHHMRLVEKALHMLGEDPTNLVFAGIGDCLDDGACPPGHYRATSEAYRGYLRARANPDRRTRELQRAAAEGDVYAQAGVLKDRVRSGEVPFEVVQVRALAGDPAARVVAEGATIQWEAIPHTVLAEWVRLSLLSRLSRDYPVHGQALQNWSDSGYDPGRLPSVPLGTLAYHDEARRLGVLAVRLAHGLDKGHNANMAARVYADRVWKGLVGWDLGYRDNTSPAWTYPHPERPGETLASDATRRWWRAAGGGPRWYDDPPEDVRAYRDQVLRAARQEAWGMLADSLQRAWSRR